MRDPLLNCYYTHRGQGGLYLPVSLCTDKTRDQAGIVYRQVLYIRLKPRHVCFRKLNGRTVRYYRTLRDFTRKFRFASSEEIRKMEVL